MTESDNGEDSTVETDTLIQHYQLDAPLDKVWRAISIPALRQHWLPELDLASPEPRHVVPGEEIRYTMREASPPYLESEVALRIAPAIDGGTVLTIVHKVETTADAANDSSITLMCAA